MLSSEASPEVTIIRTYIDWILNLPWQESSRNKYKYKEVQEILDDSHYGLEDVKRRIVEFVVVSEKVRNSDGTIICLVGPPGVGKTYTAKRLCWYLMGCKDNSRITQVQFHSSYSCLRTAFL